LSNFEIRFVENGAHHDATIAHPVAGGFSGMCAASANRKPKSLGRAIELLRIHCSAFGAQAHHIKVE
jgi:hypothetical protein